MHRLSFKSLIPLLVLALVATASTGAFAGGAVEFPGKITIDKRAHGFRGKVLSTQPRCEPDRRVKLFRKTGTKKRKRLGKDLSAGGGKWEIEANARRRGKYWAVVKRKERTINGTVFACVKSRSEKIVVD